MGNSAVAVLHYDCSAEIKEVMPRLWEAMRDFPGKSLPNEFGVGRVISWDHASGYQVCVIHGNTGWRVGIVENQPPIDVLKACANALRAHGYRVTEPKNSE